MSDERSQTAGKYDDLTSCLDVHKRMQGRE